MRFVLVGLGRMGENHLRVLDSTPGAEVVATVDAKGGATFTGLDELADSGAHFDAAIVATPTVTHFDVAHRLLQMGKHVLVEKPIASTSRQARGLIAAAEKAGARLIVGHLERLNPAVRRLASVLREDMIGAPIHFSFTRAGGYPATLLDGNNVILDLAVHDIDVFRMLVGPAKATGASAKAVVHHDVIDTAEILLRSELGVTGSVHVNWNTPTKIRDLRVTGTAGVCFVDFVRQTCEVVRGGVARSAAFEDVRSSYANAEHLKLEVPQREPLRIQIEQAIEYFGGGSRGLLCTAADGLAAVSLAERAMVLADEGYV